VGNRTTDNGEELRTDYGHGILSSHSRNGLFLYLVVLGLEVFVLGLVAAADLLDLDDGVHSVLQLLDLLIQLPLHPAPILAQLAHVLPQALDQVLQAAHRGAEPSVAANHKERIMVRREVFGLRYYAHVNVWRWCCKGIISDYTEPAPETSKCEGWSYGGFPVL